MLTCWQCSEPVLDWRDHVADFVSDGIVHWDTNNLEYDVNGDNCLELRYSFITSLPITCAFDRWRMLTRCINIIIIIWYYLQSFINIAMSLWLVSLMCWEDAAFSISWTLSSRSLECTSSNIDFRLKQNILNSRTWHCQS